MGPNQLCFRAKLSSMRWKIAVALACVAALAIPAAAQIIHGVPPSVTSFGFGGVPGFHGVPASVTSLNFGAPRGGFVPFGGFRGFVPFGGFRGVRVFHRPGGFMPFRNGAFFGGGFTPFFPVTVPVAMPFFDTWDYSDAQQQVPAVQPGQPQPIVVVVPEHVAGAEPAPAREEQPEQPRAQAPAKPEPPPVPTIFVLRNGKQLELTDFAVTGDTLYDLSNGRARKISLSEVDVPATIKVNDERGVEFSLPNSAKVQIQ